MLQKIFMFREQLEINASCPVCGKMSFRVFRGSWRPKCRRPFLYCVGR